jgi:hypothetical protein
MDVTNPLFMYSHYDDSLQRGLISTPSIKSHHIKRDMRVLHFNGIQIGYKKYLFLTRKSL